LYNGPLREYENDVLVHSTTKESWAKIKESMMIKSWNFASESGDLKEKDPIGLLLKDPKEFRDYVMLGGYGFNNEIVVLCKQLGKLVYDKNMEYTPGARIYLDAKKLANEGLLLRDGMHLKVENSIDLNKYMIDVITPFDLSLDSFTPLSFSTEADKEFRRRKKTK